MKRLSDNRRHIGNSWAIERERYAGIGLIKQRFLSTTSDEAWAIDLLEMHGEHP